MDPYRSASVVYNGTQYGTSFGHQPAQTSGAVGLTPADGATFFDQLASTVEPPPVSDGRLASSMNQAVGSTSDYYAAQYTEQSAQMSAVNGVDSYGTGAAVDATAYAADVRAPAANTTTTEGTAQSGVVYDQSVGQYYDTNSGQYYDDSTGAWYYPQIAATSAAEAYTRGTTDASVIAAVHSAVLEPISGADGVAFFDNLGPAVAEVSYSEAPQVPTMPDTNYALGPDAAAEPSHEPLPCGTGQDESSVLLSAQSEQLAIGTTTVGESADVTATTASDGAEAIASQECYDYQVSAGA
ncbi:hypothetical protein GGI21_003342, partial [Coemansia aciculifera]